MIKTLILYYLSLKPTHGYEIQKFIQLNHMDSWTKIQSGSIYYALAKLEKESLIRLQREEDSAGKRRKIYEITSAGRKELQSAVKEELQQPIYEIDSDKFIIYPVLEGISKEEVITEVKQHIDKLKSKKAELKKWEKLKVDKNSLKIEVVCFKMMISSLDYQIIWHESLLEELDQCRLVSSQMAKLIKNVDFSLLSELPETKHITREEQIGILKQEILTHPEEAADKLEQLIILLNKA